MFLTVVEFLSQREESSKGNIKLSMWSDRRILLTKRKKTDYAWKKKLPISERMIIVLIFVAITIYINSSPAEYVF